jgi:hypothetical protein
MKLKFEIEVDLEHAMLNNDSDPFVDFTASDYEEYIEQQLTSHIEEISSDCGAEIKIINQRGININ